MWSNINSNRYSRNHISSINVNHKVNTCISCYFNYCEKTQRNKRPLISKSVLAIRINVHPTRQNLTHKICAPANRTHMTTFHKVPMRSKWNLSSHRDHRSQPSFWSTSFSLPSIGIGLDRRYSPSKQLLSYVNLLYHIFPACNQYYSILAHES
jgi:hypothetical protein